MYTYMLYYVIFNLLLIVIGYFIFCLIYINVFTMYFWQYDEVKNKNAKSSEFARLRRKTNFFVFDKS